MPPIGPGIDISIPDIKVHYGHLHPRSAESDEKYNKHYYNNGNGDNNHHHGGNGGKVFR